MSRWAAEFRPRIEAARARLAAHALAADAGDARLTSPDPPTGEQWEAGQVWAHLAEFIPYWLAESGRVIAHAANGHEAPVPFGRTKSDPVRLAAVERDRRTQRRVLWRRVDSDMRTLGAFVAELPDPAWEARGVHPTRGEMSVAELCHEFLVGHLEEHAAQLDEISG